MSLRVDHLTILQGTSWEVRWPIQNKDGTPADLTGWSPRAHARAKISSETTLHEWSSELGTITIVNNLVSMTVKPNVSSAWEWRTAVFDVEMVHTDGRVVRIGQGDIRIDPEVTR